MVIGGEPGFTVSSQLHFHVFRVSALIGRHHPSWADNGSMITCNTRFSFLGVGFLTRKSARMSDFDGDFLKRKAYQKKTSPAVFFLWDERKKTRGNRQYIQFCLTQVKLFNLHLCLVVVVGGGGMCFADTHRLIFRSATNGNQGNRPDGYANPIDRNGTAKVTIHIHKRSQKVNYRFWNRLIHT